MQIKLWVLSQRQLPQFPGNLDGLEILPKERIGAEMVKLLAGN